MDLCFWIYITQCTTASRIVIRRVMILRWHYVHHSPIDLARHETFAFKFNQSHIAPSPISSARVSRTRTEWNRTDPSPCCASIPRVYVAIRRKLSHTSSLIIVVLSAHVFIICFEASVLQGFTGDENAPYYCETRSIEPNVLFKFNFLSFN